MTQKFVIITVEFDRSGKLVQADALLQAHIDAMDRTNDVKAQIRNYLGNARI